MNPVRMRTITVALVFVLFYVHRINAQEVPGEPTNVKFNEITDILVTVAWDDPANAEIVPVTGFTVTMNENEPISTTERSMTFSNLKPCFTCVFSIAAVNDNGAGPPVTITAKTVIPEVIDAVRNLGADYDNTTSNIRLSWSPPAIAELCISKYRTNAYDTVGGSTDTLFSEETEISVTQANGCRPYVFDVIPMVGVRDGVSAKVNYNTPPKETNPPEYKKHEELSFSVDIEYNMDSRQVNMCERVSLIAECEALPEDNPQAGEGTIWQASGSKSLEGFPTSETVTVDNMSDLTNYTCVGFVENIKGRSEGSSPPLKLTTKLAPPEPPLLSATDVTSNAFKLTWTEPVNNPDLITRVEANVTNMGVAYPVPVHCAVLEPIYEIIDLPLIEFEFVYESAIPYSDYEVVVNVYNDGGHTSSNVVQITTAKSAPNAATLEPADIARNENDDTYSASAKCTWKLPCELNDDVTKHVIQVVGTREGYTDEVLGPMDWTLNLAEEYQSYELNLFASYDYVITVAVHSDESAGAEASGSFLAPSGGTYKVTVPPLVGELATPPNPEETEQPHSQALFEFGSDLFGNDLGDVLYYSIILGEQETIANGFGYWDGEVWPELANGWSQNPEPVPFYEATPQKWNPFEGGETTTMLILGENETCEEGDKNCNGPLKDATEYSVQIRGFTNGGYRDTAPLKFTTREAPTTTAAPTTTTGEPTTTDEPTTNDGSGGSDGEDDGIDGALIGGIVGGVIGVLAISIIVYVLYRKGIFQKCLNKGRKSEVITG